MRDPISDEVNRPQNEPYNAGQELLERAFARENLKRAWKRVKANKGAAGVDGLDIEQTAEHLLTQWASIREQLLSGVYRPSPVRRVTIPKPDGGQRELGIPTVTDRLIQQALLQVLQPLFNPTFSEHSYGFRPGRCAQDAVLAAQCHVSSGRRKAVRCRRCWRMCCWTKLIGSLNVEVTASCAMPTMRMCMFAAARLGSG